MFEFQAFAPINQSPDANVVPIKLTWREAEDSCIGFGGHLASIETQSELNHVLSRLPNRQNNYNYWIGLYEYSHNEWRWSDGTAYGTTTYWHPNTNHGSDAMDCVGMEGQTGKWIQQNCNIGWGWVCEIPKGFYNATDEIHEVTVPSPTVNSGKTYKFRLIFQK